MFLQPFSFQPSFCMCPSRKIQKGVTNSLAFLFIGTVSSLYQNASTHNWHKEKGTTIFYQAIVGSALGLVFGWSTYFAEKVFKKCFFSFCGSQNPISLPKTSSNFMLHLCTEWTKKFVGKPFLKILPMIIAGFSSAFSSSVLQKWNLKCEGLVIGGAIGFTIGVLTHIVNYCSKKCFITWKKDSSSEFNPLINEQV